jgi:hypothetical protein
MTAKYQRKSMATKNVVVLDVACHRREIQGRIKFVVVEQEDTFEYDEHAQATRHEKPMHDTIRKLRSRGLDDEEQDFQLNDTPLRWCAIDPDLELVRRTHVQQEPAYLVFQLKQSRSVHGQCEALRSMRAHPGATTPRELCFAMQNTLYYWRVRAEAARALAKLTLLRGDSSVSLTRCGDLVMRFVRAAYYAPPEFTRVRANDFGAPGGIEVRREQWTWCGDEGEDGGGAQRERERERVKETNLTDFFLLFPPFSLFRVHPPGVPAAAVAGRRAGRPARHTPVHTARGDRHAR